MQPITFKLLHVAWTLFDPVKHVYYVSCFWTENRATDNDPNWHPSVTYWETQSWIIKMNRYTCGKRSSDPYAHVTTRKCATFCLAYTTVLSLQECFPRESVSLRPIGVRLIGNIENVFLQLSNMESVTPLSISWLFNATGFPWPSNSLVVTQHRARPNLSRRLGLTMPTPARQRGNVHMRACEVCPFVHCVRQIFRRSWNVSGISTRRKIEVVEFPCTIVLLVLIFK